MTASQAPGKSVTYTSRLTDNRIWDRFVLRPGDVIVATPPKCGTTWTQALALSLLFGKPGMDKQMDELSIWLDPAFRDQTPIAQLFEAQQHRRVIKTHTPFDGITYDPECTYLAVYRHPIDAHFSMRRQAENLKIDLIADLFPEAASDSFALFLSSSPAEAFADGITLDAIVHHYMSFKAFAHLPNVHLFHYADMKRDLPAHTRRLASILGTDLDGTILDDIARSMQFEAMQANAREKVRQSGQRSATFRDPAAFFHSATSRKWEGALSAADLDAYDRRLSALLDSAERRWLEEGGHLPA